MIDMNGCPCLYVFRFDRDIQTLFVSLTFHSEQNLKQVIVFFILNTAFCNRSNVFSIQKMTSASHIRRYWNNLTLPRPGHFFLTTS